MTYISCVYVRLGRYFCTWRGGHLFVMAVCHFFLVPTLACLKKVHTFSWGILYVAANREIDTCFWSGLVMGLAYYVI